MLFCASLLAQQKVNFSGTLEAGKTYTHAIGHGLMFVVRPQDGDFTMGVVQISHDQDDLAACVTPPYHGPGPMSLLGWQFADAQRGRLPAGESTMLKKREFKFVLTAADSKKSCDELDAVLYLPAHKEKDGSLRLGTRDYQEPPLGLAQVTIENAELSHSEPPVIQSLRFRVQIEFPKRRRPS